MGVKTYYVEDVPETVADTKEAIQTLIDEGCNLIYTNSFGFMEGTDQMAKEHPEIKFAHCSGYMREDNMSPTSVRYIRLVTLQVCCRYEDTEELHRLCCR